MMRVVRRWNPAFIMSTHMSRSYRERKCANTVGTVPVPWGGLLLQNAVNTTDVHVLPQQRFNVVF